MSSIGSVTKPQRSETAANLSTRLSSPSVKACFMAKGRCRFLRHVPGP